MSKLDEAAKAYRQACKTSNDAMARLKAAEEERTSALRATIVADAELRKRQEELQQVAAEDVGG